MMCTLCVVFGRWPYFTLAPGIERVEAPPPTGRHRGAERRSHGNVCIAGERALSLGRPPSPGRSLRCTAAAAAAFYEPQNGRFLLSFFLQLLLACVCVFFSFGVINVAWWRCVAGRHSDASDRRRAAPCDLGQHVRPQQLQAWATRETSRPRRRYLCQQYVSQPLFYTFLYFIEKITSINVCNLNNFRIWSQNFFLSLIFKQSKIIFVCGAAGIGHRGVHGVMERWRHRWDISHKSCGSLVCVAASAQLNPTPCCCCRRCSLARLYAGLMARRQNFVKLAADSVHRRKAARRRARESFNLLSYSLSPFRRSSSIFITACRPRSSARFCKE